MSSPTQPTKQLSDHFRFYDNNIGFYSYVVPLMKKNLNVMCMLKLNSMY